MNNATNANNMFSGMNKLQAVHFGANWKWIGTGCYLPNQNGVISGADGKWYTAEGTSYTPTNIPAGAGSYYATSALASAVPAATTLSFDDSFASPSNNNVLEYEPSVSLTNIFVNDVDAATYNIDGESVTGIDGSLVDPNEILFFYDEESVTNLTDSDGAVVTLYAIWKKSSDPNSNLSGYIRFINKNYLDTLSPYSKWRIGLLNDELKEAVNNDLTDVSSSYQVWEFSAKDFDDAQEWCRTQNKGYLTNINFIAKYYDKHCIIDNSSKEETG